MIFITHSTEELKSTEKKVDRFLHSIKNNHGGIGMLVHQGKMRKKHMHYLVDIPRKAKRTFSCSKGSGLLYLQKQSQQNFEFLESSIQLSKHICLHISLFSLSGVKLMAIPFPMWLTMWCSALPLQFGKKKLYIL